MNLSRALLFAGALMSTALMAEPQSPPATVSVQGHAAIEVPADQVHFSVAVETLADTADRALEANSRTMASVRKALTKSGLSQEEYKTGDLSVMPQWQPRPRNTEADWTPKIVGYRVRAQLQIESTQLKRIGDWIEAATGAGANQIGQLRFGLEDEDQYRDQAIKQAVQKARGYAQAAATAAGAAIDSLLSIQVDGAPMRPLMMQHERMGMAMADAAVKSAPEIHPGNIEVRSTVSLVYRLTER